MREIFEKYLEQAKDIWEKLSKVQKISIVSIASVLLFSFIIILIWSGKTDYGLLYSNLKEEDYQKITRYLEEKSVEYRDGGEGTSIYVPKDDRDDLRREINDYFPKYQMSGWELFDETKIGMTDFNQKVNFKRALEGELSRTINGYEQVKYSKVFLTIPEKSLFVEEEQQPTAAVNIMPKNQNIGVSKELVASITMLVSRSVTGLKPGKVVVSDFYGNLLTEDISDDPLSKISTTQFKLKKQVEERLEKKAQTMLSQMVGKGNSIVRVSAELNFDKINKQIESYDPKKTATRSEELNNEQTGETESVEHQISNYEINRVVENIVNSVGNIKRLTISVSLNYQKQDGDPQPIGDTQIASLQEIIKNSVGFKESRQDEIFVTSYPFDTSVMEEEMAEMARQRRNALIISIAKRAIIVISIFVLVLILRNMLKQFSEKYLTKEEEEEAPALEEEPIIDPELLELKKRKEEFLQQVLSLSETTPEEIAQLLRTWMEESYVKGE